MSEKSGASGGEQWLPSQHAMEGAHKFLGISSEEASGDDDLAYQEYQLAQQADVKNAADASDNFTEFVPDPQNPN